jgi:hypothetical protein
VATAVQLLRLYPPAWRARYGGEFLETAGADRLSVQQVIDITMGAIDAWLSADVRRAAAATSPTSGGPLMLAKTKLICRDTRLRMTTTDGLVSAGVLLAATFVLAFGGIWLRRSGYTTLGEMSKSLAFPVSVLVSLPFGVMKGQPWRAQAAILFVTIALLVVIGFVSTKI